MERLVRAVYSEEITELLKDKNYIIDSKTYIDIIRSSPQVNHIVYKPFGDYYEMWDSDGMYWKYKVYFSE